MEVTNYTLTASNGRKIRQATQVTYPGHTFKPTGTDTIRFMEKLSKKQAIRQANNQLNSFYISPYND